MTEEDEIDVLGDFTFDENNSSNVITSSCSDLLQCDYTVHPQWLLDTATTSNWYDNVQTTDDLVLKRSLIDQNIDIPPRPKEWTNKERELLLRGMEIYGRDAKCLSQFISSKSESEVKLLIEKEYGINLEELPTAGITYNISESSLTEESIPDPVEEVVCVNNDIQNIKLEAHSRKKNKSNSSTKTTHQVFDSGGLSESNKILYYEEDFFIGNTESVEVNEIIENTEGFNEPVKRDKRYNKTIKIKKMETHSKYSKRKPKFDIRQMKTNTKVTMRPEKAAYLADSVKLQNTPSSPQMQIVTGSGQTLPLCHGEQVIKIDKNAGAESSSDVDVGSDDDAISSPKKLNVKKDEVPKSTLVKQDQVEFFFKQSFPQPTSLSFNSKISKTESKPFTLRKRKQKLILDGDGGYTITHSEFGDIYELGLEPRSQTLTKKQAIGLVHCKSYTSEHPAPYHVMLSTTALLLMDVHAHTSRAEVMGLLGGKYNSQLDTLHVEHYAPCESLENSGTHCDMCPVSQSLAYEELLSKGCEIVGWYHSHPRFPPHPSAQDITSQIDMQSAFSNGASLTEVVPFVGIIISPHWAPGRTASQYRCLCVEKINMEDGIEKIAYRFSVNLHKDITNENITTFLKSVDKLNKKSKKVPIEFSVDMAKDICPDARITYLNKCISSVHHHLRSSGYTEDGIIPKLILSGIKDVFR